MRKAFTPSQDQVYASIIDDATKRETVTRGDAIHEEETEYILYNKEHEDGVIIKIVIVIKINGYIQMTYTPEGVIKEPVGGKIHDILNGKFKGWHRVVYSDLELEKFKTDFANL